LRQRGPGAEERIQEHDDQGENDSSFHDDLLGS
jgi:hypothetical protein